MANMEEIQEPYKGYILSHFKIPMTGADFTVTVTSENLSALNRIGGTSRLFNDHPSFSENMAEAKRFVDEVYASHAFKSA